VPIYQRTQIGWVIRIATLGPAVVIAGVLAFAHHASPVLWVTLAVTGGTGLVFGALTIEVDQERLAFWFGPGVVRKSFLLSDIASCRVVTNPWWYGWGIHLTPAGWLYNISGRQAVELQLRDGRRLRVGTDEPAELCRVLGSTKGREK